MSKIQGIELTAIAGRRGYAPDIILNTETDEQVAACANPDLTALFVAAPEMLALLELLAAGYECPPVMSGDNVYDSRDELLRETDHYSCLAGQAAQLLAKIKGGDE